MFPSQQTFSQTRTFGSLDGLRALSILGVLWLHAWIIPPYYQQLQSVPVLRMGAFGVDVFFSLSGFLIATLLLREKQRNGDVSLRAFYIRRTLRIWPLYYTTLVLYILMVLVLERGSGRDRVFFHCLPGYLTFTFTWFPAITSSQAIFGFAWSLSVEEQFYLLWAPLLRFFRARWPPVVALVLISVQLSAAYGLLWRIVDRASFLGRVAENISIAICLGVLLAHALDSERGFSWAWKVLGKKASAPAALGLLLLSLIPAPDLSVRLLQLAALPILVGACVIREDNGLAPFLRLRWVAHLGKVSYGMYMLNSLLLRALRPLLTRLHVTHPAIVFVPFVVVTAAVASLSYRYFESPFLMLKQRFERLRPHREAVETLPQARASSS